jgi:methionyl aminopeptidase
VFRSRERIQVKSAEQIELMRTAGLVVGQALDLLTRTLAPGLTTRQLDAVAEEFIRGQGATPSFKGYHGFPATICVSVNDEIVHGIPGDRVIEDGDLVSIDCGAIVDGWHGDAAVTVAVGDVSPAEAQLLTVTEDALWAGLAAARVGGRLTDISHAVEASVRAAGSYGIVEEYVGHGIGTEMYMDP